MSPQFLNSGFERGRGCSFAACSCWFHGTRAAKGCCRTAFVGCFCVTSAIKHMSSCMCAGLKHWEKFPQCVCVCVCVCQTGLSWRLIFLYHWHGKKKATSMHIVNLWHSNEILRNTATCQCNRWARPRQLSHGSCWAFERRQPRTLRRPLLPGNPLSSQSWWQGTQGQIRVGRYLAILCSVVTAGEGPPSEGNILAKMTPLNFDDHTRWAIWSFFKPSTSNFSGCSSCHISSPVSMFLAWTYTKNPAH